MQYSYSQVPEAEYSADEEEDVQGSALTSSRVSEDDASAELGGLTLEFYAQGHLTMDCRIEKNCLYGAAIAMPQLARSGGWQTASTTLAVRVYVMLLVNYFLSGFLAYSLIAKQNVLDPYQGQPNLCDFGAEVSHCPGAPGCTGPGGSQIAEDKLFDWPVYHGRRFVKASLMALFPQMQEKIDKNVDPGEYGVESYWCRLVCIFIFVTAILDDFYAICRTMMFLVVVPTRAECWIGVKCEQDDQAPVPDLNELNLQVAGISMLWKCINVMTVVIPRAMLWCGVCRGGTMLLMESSDLTDMIVNTVALNFILDINKFLFQAYELRATKHFLNVLVDYKMHDQSNGLHTQSDLLSWNMTSLEVCKLAAKLFPHRLLLAVAIASWFIFEYYSHYCERSADGTWISKVLREPDNVKSVVMAMLPRQVLWMIGLPDQAMLEAEVMWSMGTLGGGDGAESVGER